MTRIDSTPHMRAAVPFVLGLVGAFAVMRLWMSFTPDADFDVLGYNVHHLFTGVLILTLCVIPLVIGARSTRALTLLRGGLGVGLGLILDEWVYLIATDGSNASYLLPVSFWGGALFIALAVAYALAYAVFTDRRDNSRT